MDSKCTDLWPQGLEPPWCQYKRHISERTVLQAGKDKVEVP